jgi:hypothetical protein
MRRSTETVMIVVWAMAVVAGSVYWASVALAQEAGGSSVAEIRRAYAEGRDADAVVLADRVLAGGIAGQEAPRGEIHFWRGAALRRLKRPDEALVAFQAAERLGYSSPELRLERALALAAAGRGAEAEASMADARSMAQEDRNVLQGLEERWNRRDDGGPKRLEIRIRPEAGFDSNIFSTNDNAILLNDVQGNESPYYGGVFSARYWLIEGDRDRTSLSLEYLGTVRAFSDEPDLSYADNQLSLTSRVPLGRGADFELGLSASDAILTEDRHLRTLKSVQPAFLFAPAEGLQFRLWGDWSLYTSYQNTPEEQDRDGTIQRVGVSATVDVGGGWYLSPFVSYAAYDAEGSDFVSSGWEPGLALSTPEFLGVQAAIRGSLAFVSFDNSNSLTGFTEKREDRRTTVTLTIRLPALERLAGYAPGLTVSFQDWNSNVEAYDFERWDSRLEVSFLAMTF